ncbi:MAG TPA: LCP family protein [Marmoricola sp.]|nr:LCP family protein [Marmoricola sp.]
MAPTPPGRPDASSTATSSATSSATSAPGLDRGAGAARVRFRRAIALMVMTLVLPGSAQLVAGRKETGRLAMRIWFGLWAAALVVLLVGLVSHGFVFWFITSGFVLGATRILLMVLAVGWAWLFVDAWRLGEPLSLQRQHRLAVVGINGVLCFSMAGSLLFASHVVAVQKDFLSSMFNAAKVTSVHDGRYNILLLGGDSGADRWGLRPDSINVVSIDANTGRSVIFGLPRNMLNFPFAKGSLMAKQFPHGYDCGIQCELNSLVTWTADHKSLFKGVRNPGVEATTEAVEGITGLKINYYAMVNLAGFRKLVNAVGGVTLNVRDRIPIGGIGAPITGYIEPGVHRLNGYQTLWFARSRVAADDYSRMARQKCVMNAMLHQLSPQTVVLKFERIAKASEALLSTDIPRSEVDTFMQLALQARQQPIRTVSFVPPAINTGRPDIAKIQSMVKKAIASTEGTKAPKKHHRAHAPKQATTTGGSIGDMQDGYAANQSADLSASC